MNVLDEHITEEESRRIYLKYLTKKEERTYSILKFEREVYNDMHENLRKDSKIFFNVYNYYKVCLN